MRVRDEIIRLLQAGTPHNQIAKQLHCAKSTVSFHAIKLGLADPKMQKAGLRYNWDNVQKYYNEGHSTAECAKKFGFSVNTWEAAIKAGRIQLRTEKAIPIEEVLTAGRTTTISRLKRRLIASGMIENKCVQCGIDEWNGKPLTLQLDHINGDRKDNRIENLRLLCPNCHTQTETYGSKNRRSYISKQEHEKDGLYKCYSCSKREGKTVLKKREEFYRHKNMRNGIDVRCKTCVNEALEEYK